MKKKINVMKNIDECEGKKENTMKIPLNKA